MSKKLLKPKIPKASYMKQLQLTLPQAKSPRSLLSPMVNFSKKSPRTPSKKLKIKALVTPTSELTPQPNRNPIRRINLTPSVNGCLKMTRSPGIQTERIRIKDKRVSFTKTRQMSSDKLTLEKNYSTNALPKSSKLNKAEHRRTKTYENFLNNIQIKSTNDKDITDFIRASAQRYKLSTSQSRRPLLKVKQISLSNPKSTNDLSTKTQENLKLLPQKVGKFAFRSQKGSYLGKDKKHNQDAYIIKADFAGTQNQYFFAVLDGHGINGHEVAKYVKKFLPFNIATIDAKLLQINKKQSEQTEETLKWAMVYGYKQTNYELSCQPINIQNSGTTAVSVLIRGDLLICANVGDSRAVLGRKGTVIWESVPLSTDQNPEVQAERDVIEKAGGVVDTFKDEEGHPMGPLRIWVPGKNPPVPGLAMTRSIGDRLAQSIGLTATPEIRSGRLTLQDKFIILASDGLWEFIDNDLAVATVGMYWKKGNPREACDKLIEMASKRWMDEDKIIDDITVVIVFLES